MDALPEDEDLVRQELTVYFCQLAEAFGLPRSIALIYAALYLAEKPLSVAEVIEKSGLSKGSVSHGLRLLERMKFIHPVISPTDRRSFYRPELSLRKLAIGLVEENFLPALRIGGGIAGRPLEGPSRLGPSQNPFGQPTTLERNRPRSPSRAQSPRLRRKSSVAVHGPQLSHIT